ncbi:MAG: hypothetical protein A3F67_04545 [Verrucomicrobia bacterium RIFCSPHIGHO2_12_FULL_41_10]|nr:MAG: hypothetical protein A3F67_04545 [Verrucomicrobia bacterium RIFCSPHIGHO2_12_FULL_41_10]HLB32665.1 hypothetical protein [Chthoniobacterales bacterium]
MSTIDQISTLPTKPIRTTSHNSMIHEEGSLWYWAQERRKIFFIPSEETIKPIRSIRTRPLKQIFHHLSRKTWHYSNS